MGDYSRQRNGMCKGPEVRESLIFWENQSSLPYFTSGKTLGASLCVVRVL